MLTFSIETITPEIAKSFLEKNTCNRSVRKGQVQKYARDIALGRWFKETAEPIKFNCDGTLLDGQHRLLACIEANRPIIVTVARGVPHTAMEYLDSGEAKDAGDILTIIGHHNTHQLASAANILIDFKMGTTRKGGRPRADVIDMVRRHPDLAISVSRCSGIRCGIPPSLLSAMHYVGASLIRNPEQTNAFIEVLDTGVPSLGQFDPAFVWRERIVRSKITTSKHMTLARDAVAKGTIHAYNLYRDGVKIKKFPIPEKYPEITGLPKDLI